MQVIKIAVQIEEDRIIHLPDDVPLGRAELTIQPLEQTEKTEVEALIEQLWAEGELTDAIRAPEGAVALTAEEIKVLGRLKPGERPMHEWIDEDRGPR